MSYLDRLKGKISGNAPEPEATKATKGAFVPFVAHAPTPFGIFSEGEVGAGDTATTPFDPEAWEERAAIAEFDGGLTKVEAEQLAWQEDDRRRCNECRHYRREICAIAMPGGVVSANRGYRPWQGLPRRCEGFKQRELAKQ